MNERDDRQDEQDREVGRGAEELDAALDEILGESGAEGEEDALDDLVDQDEMASLLGGGPVAAAPDGEEGEPSQEEMDGVLDDVYAGGRRLARVGDCVLMASEDGMRAWFRGQLPEGTTFQDAAGLLEEAGIRFGIVQARIHDALPRKRPRRRRERNRARPEPERKETIVAEGRLPVPPEESRVEFHVHQADEEQVRQIRTILEGYDFEAVQRCAVPLTFVRPGQLLAEAILGEGHSGCDVFGEEIPAPLPDEAVLEAGENAALAEDGKHCVAADFGYAAVAEGKVGVLSPVWVSRDLMRAFLVLLPQEGGFPELKVAEVEKVLRQNGIVHGILDEEIRQLCGDLRRGKPVERVALVARGTEATPGRDAFWEFLCDPNLTRYFGQIQRVLSRSREVRVLEEDAQGLAGKAVSAGERLAIKRPPAPGEMGRDVFGEEFLPDEPEDAVLEGGENIRFAEDGTACSAEIFGYIGISRQGNRVEIASPIWVTRDRMAAYFVHLPQLGEKRVPTPEEIDCLLEQAGVRFGIAQRMVGLLCEKMRQKLPVDLAVCLARGKKPLPGEDGGFDFAVDRERKPGFFRKDGSVDFKQLNLAPLLDAGQEIGRHREATPGTPGTDVGGRELSARDGRPVRLDVGQNVRLVRVAGEPDQYQAEVEGELVVVDRLDQPEPVIHIAVHQVKSVEGDVDFHTGNIDFPGSVHVKGAVRTGFKVKAGGNVVVGDSVEDGAVVEAGGNVAVRNGIAGEKTQVKAEGDVFAKFINAARVRARGDLNIAEYIFGAPVQAGGEIVVWGTTGSRTSGLIAGGTAMAGKRIRAQAVGTDGAPATRLMAGVDGGLLRQATELQQRIDQYNGAIGKALQFLQVERMPQAQIKQVLLNLVLKARGPRKKIMARAVRNLLELQTRLGQAAARKKQVDGQLERIAARASVEVTKRIAARTLVKIGGHTRTVGEDGAQVIDVRFALGKDKKGKTQLQMTAD